MWVLVPLSSQPAPRLRFKALHPPLPSILPVPERSLSSLVPLGGSGYKIKRSQAAPAWIIDEQRANRAINRLSEM